MLESERQNQIWDGMLKKYGVYELARKIARRELYRKYVSRWPWDHTQRRLSLEVLQEEGFDPASTENVAEAFSSEQTVEDFLSTLTPKQRQVVEDLMPGFTPKDLYRKPEYNYKSTGGIRYHKWVLRKKWKAFIDDRANFNN